MSTKKANHYIVVAVIAVLWVALCTAVMAGQSFSGPGKPYHFVQDYAKATNHRKACVVGKVVYRRKMADGDWHITLEKDGQKMVAEIIPELPVPAPSKGMTILACGISGYDTKHKWNEIHPLVKWKNLDKSDEWIEYRPMAELADALVLETSGATHVGSTPTGPTNFIIKNVKFYSDPRAMQWSSVYYAETYHYTIAKTQTRRICAID